jgi:hypothetical protein
LREGEAQIDLGVVEARVLFEVQDEGAVGLVSGNQREGDQAVVLGCYASVALLKGGIDG